MLGNLGSLVSLSQVLQIANSVAPKAIALINQTHKTVMISERLSFYLKNTVNGFSDSLERKEDVTDETFFQALDAMKNIRDEAAQIVNRLEKVLG